MDQDEGRDQVPDLNVRKKKKKKKKKHSKTEEEDQSKSRKFSIMSTIENAQLENEGVTPVSRKTSSEKDPPIMVPSKSAGMHTDGDYTELMKRRKLRLSQRQRKKGLTHLEQPAITIPQEQSSVSDDDHEQLRLRNEVLDCINKDDVGRLSEMHRRLKSRERLPLFDDNVNALHHALAENAYGIVDYLMENETASFLMDEFISRVAGKTSKKNALHVLAERNDVERARKLIGRIDKPGIRANFLVSETLAQVEGQRPRDLSPILIAAMHGHLEFVKLLLSFGVDVNHQNKKHDTAILWASRFGHIELVRYLISQHADVGLENDKGSTPLHWAVRYDHVEAVKTLIEEGKVDVNQKRKLGLVLPLVLASALGSEEIVELLLQQGARVNEVIRGGETALQHAASEGHLEVVKILLRHGAQLEQEDDLGYTPLLLAGRNGFADVALFLAREGADFQHETLEGKTIWDYAVENPDSDLLVGLIDYMRETADFNVFVGNNKKDKGPVPFPKGRTPLHVASSLGVCDKIALLIEHGVDPAACDGNDNTFLHVAATTGMTEVLRKFADATGVAKQNIDGDTVMHVACRSGEEDCVEALLKFSKMDAKNNRGERPLHAAIHSQNTNPDIVKLLVNHIITNDTWTLLDEVDNEGNTALHFAARQTSPEVLKYLRNLNIKQKNNDGDNPLHVAAINEACPEVFNTMLDIFRTQRGGDIDLNQRNAVGETLFHIVAKKGDVRRIEHLIRIGADLSLQDADGNTMLHTTAFCVADDDAFVLKGLDICSCIVENSVRWWCNKQDLSYPDDDRGLYQRLKVTSLLFLTTKIFNNEDTNVFGYAAHLGALEIIRFLLNVPGVTKFETRNAIKYDITNISTKSSPSKGLKKHSTAKEPRRGSKPGRSTVSPSKVQYDEMDKGTDASTNNERSLIEIICDSPLVARSAKILSITPISQMADDFWSTYQWLYGFLMVLHVLYMSLLCAYCVPILPPPIVNGNYTLTDSSGVTTNVDYEVYIFPYILFLLWPLLIMFAEFYFAVRECIIHKRAPNFKDSENEHANVSDRLLHVLWVFFNEHVTYFIGTFFCVLVVAWFGLYAVKYEYQDYVLATAIIIGWLYGITFTKAFESIHQFSQMLKFMIIRDLTRFMFVYLFVLLAFGFAFYALFQGVGVPYAAKTQPMMTLYSTFMIMVGFTEQISSLSGDDFDQTDRSRNFFQVLFTLYLIVGTIVLLNLLIALMNDSYSEVRQKEAAWWRVYSLRLALQIERSTPLIPKLMDLIRLGKLNMMFDLAEERWFLTLSKKAIRGFKDLASSSDEDALTDTVARLDGRLYEMEKSLQSINRRLDSLHDTQRIMGARLAWDSALQKLQPKK
ncbi:uncharacterized protein LOC106160149 isoform X1 [Lingula anatina]|uniref:Uncharacterized protein LOC106160149 isoform X1 n=1 Tax=Lingula anatina TaxID=7574 RepID=A0A1S3I1H8_LINAN|nr:uncharacterized protein LOC106160149 isoform X1 [Lingula anatina]|eukprot:XP_013392120.1 uncharacterized protein LOC106160149 isoform X1 [Lingula anatina]